MTTNSHKTMQLHVRRCFRSEYLILREAVKVIHVVHVAARRVPSNCSHILPAISNCRPRFWVMVRPRLQKNNHKWVTNTSYSNINQTLLNVVVRTSNSPRYGRPTGNLSQIQICNRYAHPPRFESLATRRHASQSCRYNQASIADPSCTVQCFPTADQE